MAQNMIFTAMGKDKPGIVAGVSKVLYESGYNIEDSSMTLLKGEFAMILVISGKEDLSPAQFSKKFDSLKETFGLSIFLRELSPDELVHKVDEQVKIYAVSVYGVDKPGIVYEITQLLADKNVNIVDVNTQIAGTKEEPVYVILLEVEAPLNMTEEQLRKDLENAGIDLKVNVSMHLVEAEEL
ncbi:ACT domain-containing protein [bacterium]|nr:ACT domain-containing protein [bacterium]